MEFMVCWLHILYTWSKLYDVHVSVVNTPSFEAVYCFICGRRRVAVARYRMIRLVLLKVYSKSFFRIYPFQMLVVYKDPFTFITQLVETRFFFQPRKFMSRGGNYSSWTRSP